MITDVIISRKQKHRLEREPVFWLLVVCRGA